MTFALRLLIMPVGIASLFRPRSQKEDWSGAIEDNYGFSLDLRDIIIYCVGYGA
jgi:hypothetical protein